MDDITLPDGTTIRLGCKQPDVHKFSAAPAWDESNPVLSEEECADTDDLLQFLSPIKYQHNNNCTNASLAGLAEACERANGTEDVQPLSMTMQYALHNGGVDEGAMCRDLADDFRKRGICRASLFPDSQLYVPRGGMTQAVLDDAKNHVALEIYQCMDWAHVRSALALNFFVYHGFVLGRAFVNGNFPNGKVPEFDGKYVNGHAMFSCGLTRKFGALRAITPNSWSASWGDKGIGYTPASYFWSQSGSYVNLDAFAVRAMKKVDHVPVGG